MVRIAIDAHMVGHRETGNETYVVNLLRGLAAGSGDEDFQVLTTDPRRLAGELHLPGQFRPVRVWPGLSVLRIPFGMPAALKTNHADLLHATYILPPRAPCPMVVTVHDLSFFPFPEALSARARLVLRWLVPVSVRTARRVIAISESTKQDLVRYCRVSPEKIRVTYLAADAQFRPDASDDIGDLPSGVRRPYLLAVGNLEPRKNLSRLIDAFVSLTRDRGFEGQLVLAGNRGGTSRQLAQRLRLLGIESRVVITGYVTRRQLQTLYNQAAVFVYPSLYEGFGLPAIEAMASGCPVVASNVTALPEVVDDAALTVDPRSTEQLLEAIDAVIKRPALAQRLRGKGLIRASAFSWQRTAQQTRAVYAEALAEGKR